MFVLGTAGHVDHGKSALVRAITGIDPDRLREEKERGMTIDLGFAWLKLPSGREISIVDVPGHERFIKNMLAGVGGIDLALLIVAADEGVMPQTSEHLAILDLLRVNRGVIVITKRDLVDDDWLELVMADVREAVLPTCLHDAPMLAVSAITGAGLPELIERIDALVADLPERSDRGRPRLPIDRVFTISGFGTVVTGTLIDGRLSVGQEVEILPSGHRTRIRGLQSHQHKVEEAKPGSRVAANLTGLATTDLSRGDVLTTPGWLKAAEAFDVRLRVLDSLDRPLTHNASVTVHLGASESPAKVRLLEGDEIWPGESGWAQIRAERPLVGVKGDLFILRASDRTIGGGEIVDPGARRHRRNNASTISRLSSLEKGTPAEILLEVIGAKQPIEFSALVKTAPLPEMAVTDALHELSQAGSILILGGRALSGSAVIVTASFWGATRDRTRELLAAYHRQYPLRTGMSKEELKSRLKLTPRAFADGLQQLLADGSVTEVGSMVRAPDFLPEPPTAIQPAIRAYLAALQAAPYAPAPETALDSEALGYLEDSGQIVRTGDSVAFSAEAYAALLAGTTEHIKATGKISVGEFRDLFQTSRKYALAFLEHLDEKKITRRQGDDRVLR